MKRILIILAIVLVVGGVIYAGYFLSNKNVQLQQPGPSGSLPPPAGTSPEGVAPEVSTGTSVSAPTGTAGAKVGLSLVSSEKFVSFSVATSGLVYGVRPDGTVFSVSPSGTVAPISSSPIDSFSGASFSSDGKKMLSFWGTPDTRQFSVFDITSSTWQPLPLNTVSAAWQPQSHTVGYLSSQNGAKVLFSWNLDKPKIKASSLLTLHFEDLEVGYLSPSKIYLTGKKTGLVKNFLNVFDTVKKTLTPVFLDVFGLDTKWNSSGSSALAFFGGQYAAGGTLRITDQTGKSIKQIDSLFLTLPEKCLFSADVFAAPAPVSTSTKALPPPPPENFLYCAVPRDTNSLSSALLPDDYFKFKLLTVDNIYKIDLDSGTLSTVFDDAGKSFDVQSPAIVGTTLFFINRYDQNLYALPIPRG